MNQQTLHSPTVANVTLKRNRTSILRSNEPIFLVEGSYWPRVLLSDSVDKRLSKRSGSRSSGTSSKRSSPITKVSRRGTKNIRNGMSSRKVHKALLHQMIKSSKLSTLPARSMPLLPSLVDLSALIEEQHNQLRWRPSPVARPSCSSFTGKAWPVPTASRDKTVLQEEERQPRNGTAESIRPITDGGMRSSM